MSRKMVCMDGNAAVAHVAHATNEVIAIYPITPSSAMGEGADSKSAAGQKNIWGTIPKVVEMQAEGGAAGAVHGALQAGALATTFTASQGLLLMIPNMFKIAGELTSTVFHVAARAVATHALSIFGDHSDVMACRSTGWAMLVSNNPQECMDMALIAQATTLRARVPFLHFFDGFRTSNEIQKIEELTFDDMRAMIDDDLVAAHRLRALSPDRPIIRGTAQNPDVFFQGREAANRFYKALPDLLQAEMDKFAKLTNRQYRLYGYVGAPDAERVVVCMGSACDTVHELVEHLAAEGEKIGLVKVRLFQPLDVKRFVETLPKTVRRIAVLDRTKEPGSVGEPLYLAVRSALDEWGGHVFGSAPVVVGGRYGLGSFEFSPAMAKAVFDNLATPHPKNHFTVGICDDVTGTSLKFDPEFRMPHDDLYQAMFYGLGSDGTVGANKNSIKIIGNNTENRAQAYFVYDSKKAGSMTTSHLRFGPQKIRAPYLVENADFVACHNFSFLEKYNILGKAKTGATFLLNSPYDKKTVWKHLPLEVQKQIIDKKLQFYIIDGVRLGNEIGLGPRINIIMQTAFFKISGILPIEQAVEAIKNAIVKSYGKSGEKVVNMNFQAVEAALANLEKVTVPAQAKSDIVMKKAFSDEDPEFIQKVTGQLIDGLGEQIPVSALPVDGTYPVGTSRYEKRNIAVEIPVWDPQTCVQCGICSLLCPHAVIRMKIYEADLLKEAPETFKSTDARDMAGKKFTLQISPEDCTGCGVCVHNCPAKNRSNPERKALSMAPQEPLRIPEIANWNFFLDIPDTDPALFDRATVKGSQLLRPLFEFSGACAGCGETAFVKLLSQLFGDRALIANATGCASIYGGNLPTTPWTTRADGRGPSWANSLFEDNAEFGLGMRLTVDKLTEYAKELLKNTGESATLIEELTTAPQNSQTEIEAQRARVGELKAALQSRTDAESKALLNIADFLVKKSVWILGGDGWAYDIGYGGLDHVLASGANVNVLVLDTEVYSNTGGQASKATPLGAVAQFAAAGKRLEKKDLGMIAMTYGSIYVARVSLGNPVQLIKAFIEAESYDGPSLILAYCHCIAHGINMTAGIDEDKKALKSGHWPLYRFDPRRASEGKNPLQIDAAPVSMEFTEFAGGENRFRVLRKAHPEIADALMNHAAEATRARFNLYQKLAQLQPDCEKEKK